MDDARLNLNLVAKLSQKILITPQMRQSISLLLSPITTLNQEIFDYIQQNPLIEVGDISSDDNITNSSNNILDDINNPAWDSYFNQLNENSIFFLPTNRDVSDYNYENYLSYEESLETHLINQLKTLSISEVEYDIGYEIINNLDENGYFKFGIENLSSDLGVDLSLCRDMLALIKSFEPVGIASESLSECILTQLRSMQVDSFYYDMIEKMLTDYIDYLENYRFSEIETKLGIDNLTMEKLIYYIRKTDPKPSLGFSNRDNLYIEPDVYLIRDISGKFDIDVNDNGLPPLKLNSSYLKILNLTKDISTKDYIEDKLKNAIWFIKSLLKRQKTIYTISKAIIDTQEDFLIKGEAYLKPLKLRDIADITGLSESTVSRATSGKYIMTHYGVLELKSFFSKGMDSLEGDISTRKIKKLIKNIIDNESNDKPYSDENIVKALMENGVTIARRTVAKYRDELGIPTMAKRKKMWR